ncbi:hypothetical protein CLV92_109115 [Kineococcus xinjiangensis]|uniref:Uncharacterized protein n=1 Tax=Kineococcus xinjiangensis TaxID=512762 RepID=A0A2S6II13_9ACTN|nr:hypothetical protein [Kineococcus xinjiangensis]PPK93838.1 hypothetical protein CLV92_109115 [Kineococcus xinjiangensis]
MTDGSGAVGPRDEPAEDAPDGDVEPPELDAAGTERIRALLRAAAPVGPMPAEVATRVDAALARATAEVRAPDVASPGVAGEDEAGEDVGAERRAAVVSLTERRLARSRRWRRVLSTAAAVLVVGGAGAAVTQLGPLTGGGAMEAGSAPASGGNVPESYAGGAGAADTALVPGSAVVTRSGTEYTRAEAAAQVAALLAPTATTAEQESAAEETQDRNSLSQDATGAEGAGPDAASSAPGPETGPQSSVQEDADLAARALGCAESLGAPTEAALAVDVASWQGAPAVVVVLPGQGGTAEAVVVAQQCEPGQPPLARFDVPL